MIEFDFAFDTTRAGKVSILKEKHTRGKKKHPKFTNASARGNFTREARITWSRSREKIPTGNVREGKKKGRGEQKNANVAALRWRT